MKNQNEKFIKCPKCGEMFEERLHALSRKDNETKICSQCGTDEAMESFLKFMKNVIDVKVSIILVLTISHSPSYIFLK